jgi:hypothetical protein
MEKRISFFQFQSVKNVAKAIDPKLREMVSLQKRAIALKAELDDEKARLQREIDTKTGKMEQEFKDCKAQIDLLEAGIVQTLGFHVSDLVKKVIEPTGKTDPKTGKALTVTKYLPTDIVTYDEKAKEYVVTVPEEGEAEAEPECPTPETEEPVEEAPEEMPEEYLEEKVEEAAEVEEADPFGDVAEDDPFN